MADEQTKQTNWIDEEIANATQQPKYEQLPALKLQPNKITEIDIDASKPFEKWDGEDNKGKQIVKKIIPLTSGGIRMNFWLNVKNPLYRELLDKLKKGQTKFKILQTGTQAETKYNIVE